MTVTAELVLAIIGFLITWTASIFGIMVWLTGKFSDLTATVYRVAERHRRENDVQFDDLGRRVQRLELHAFGFAGPVAVEPRPRED